MRNDLELALLALLQRLMVTMRWPDGRVIDGAAMGDAVGRILEAMSHEPDVGTAAGPDGAA